MRGFVNVAGWDRAVRIVLGLVMLYLGWAGIVGGTLGWVLKLAGFLPLVTGVVGWCPLYDIIGVSTCARRTGTA